MKELVNHIHDIRGLICEHYEDEEPLTEDQKASKHSFMIMPTKDEVEREISRYYKIALAKLKRAREFVKKVNLNGQYNILEGDYRQTILEEIYKQ